jgi:hypothetical protein
MRFTTLVVLAVVAPMGAAFLPAANVFNKHPSTLSMALEDDLESKLFSTPAEKKKISKEAAKRAKATPAAPISKKTVLVASTEKRESLSGISTSDINYDSFLGKPAAKVKPVKAVKPVAAKKEKPAPRQKFVRAPREELDLPPRRKQGGLPQQKPASTAPPSNVDSSVLPTGLALGAAPLVVLPLAALAAGRSFLSNTSARRQAIQEAIDEKKRIKESKSADVDFGDLFKAAVRTEFCIVLPYCSNVSYYFK